MNVISLFEATTVPTVGRTCSNYSEMPVHPIYTRLPSSVEALHSCSFDRDVVIDTTGKAHMHT